MKEKYTRMHPIIIAKSFLTFVLPITRDLFALRFQHLVTLFPDFILIYREDKIPR